MASSSDAVLMTVLGLYQYLASLDFLDQVRLDGYDTFNPSANPFTSSPTVILSRFDPLGTCNYYISKLLAFVDADKGTTFSISYFKNNTASDRAFDEILRFSHNDPQISDSAAVDISASGILRDPIFLQASQVSLFKQYSGGNERGLEDWKSLGRIKSRLNITVHLEFDDLTGQKVEWPADDRYTFETLFEECGRMVEAYGAQAGVDTGFFNIEFYSRELVVMEEGIKMHIYARLDQPLPDISGEESENSGDCDSALGEG